MAAISSSSHLEVVGLSPEDGELRHELPVDPPAELNEGGLLAGDGGVAASSARRTQPHLTIDIISWIE